MILPTPSQISAGKIKTVRSVVVYYLMAFVIAAFNFAPVFTHAYDKEVHPTPQRTVYLLIVCSMLSAVLLFEFLFDVVIWIMSKSAANQAEPRFGNFLMILSLFLPVVIVYGSLEDAHCPFSDLFVNCYVSFLQTLIIIAQYRKLQDRYWTASCSLICTTLFVASQVSSSYGIIYSEHDYNSYDNYPLTVSLSLAFVSGELDDAMKLIVDKIVGMARDV